MFRSIRNKRNEISTDEAKELLRSSRRGILAVNGDDGYPYAIPINYLYDEDAHKIVFHGAKAGYKVDCLKVCDKVCCKLSTSHMRSSSLGRTPLWVQKSLQQSLARAQRSTSLKSSLLALTSSKHIQARRTKTRS